MRTLKKLSLKNVSEVLSDSELKNVLGGISSEYCIGDPMETPYCCSVWGPGEHYYRNYCTKNGGSIEQMQAMAYITECMYYFYEGNECPYMINCSWGDC